MSATADIFCERCQERLRELLRQMLVEELEPVRHLLIRAAPEPSAPEAEQLVDAEAVAHYLGYDTSTPTAARAARQRIYHLARTRQIPSVRVSPRKLQFDMVAVKRQLLKGSEAAGRKA
jgi:hypothetical protein